MKKLLKRLGLTVVVLLAAIQLYRPERSNPPVEPRMSVETIHPMTPGAAEAWSRACRDCHSNETIWPWYSNVAPVSWLVIGHVDDARRHMNVSTWGRYDRGDATSRLKKICRFSREGEMPLTSYTLIHWGAKLSDEDIKEICAWTDAVREALREASPEGGG